MGNLFSDKYDDHFYSSKKDEEEQKKKEQQPVEETPEEREERELRELTYDRSSKRKRILIIGAGREHRALAPLFPPLHRERGTWRDTEGAERRHYPQNLRGADD